MVRYGKLNLSVGKISEMVPNEEGFLVKVNSIKGCRDDIFYIATKYYEGMEKKIEVGNVVMLATEAIKSKMKVEYDEVYKNEIKRLEESMTKRKFDEYMESDQFKAFQKQHMTKNLVYPHFKTCFVHVLDDESEIEKGIPYNDCILKDIAIKCLNQSTKR